VQPPLNSQPGIRYLKGILDRKFRKEKTPVSATISITKNCQCLCKNCQFMYYQHTMKNNLKLDEFKEAIRQAVELGVTTIVLSGGEPLIRKGLYKLIESVDKSKANVILFSNGEYLTLDRCQKLKSAGIYGIFVAFDSWTKGEQGDTQQTDDMFSKAVTAIENINKAGILSGIHTYFSTERIRYDRFEKFVEFSKKIGAKELIIQDIVSTKKEATIESKILKEPQRKLIQEWVKKIKKKKNFPGISFQSTLLNGNSNSINFFGEKTHFYVTAAGDMCPYEYAPISIGKFPERSIRFLWAKMGIAKPFANKDKSFRMLDPEFRKKFINQIPKQGPFPFPIDRLEK
jgi:MoaA/NifB/PqqE/SkfB family radical SAM enzyme